MLNTLVAVSLSLSPSQCRGGRCSAPSFQPIFFPTPVAQTAPVQSAPLFSGWQQVDGNEWHAFKDGVRVGGWRKDYQVYLTFDAKTGEWSTTPSLCPLVIPKDAMTRNPPSPIGQLDGENFGIDVSKLKESGCEYWLNGHRVSKIAQFEAMGKKNLEDDSGKWSLTAVGDESFCKKFEDASVELKDKYHVHCYKPDSPILRDQKLPTDGGKVHLQKPDGTKIGSLDGFSDKADLAAKVKGLESPLSDPLRVAKELPGWAWALIGMGLMYLFRNKQ